MRQLREFGFGRRTMAELIQAETGSLVDDLTTKVRQSGPKGLYMNMADAFSVNVLNTLWTMMAGIRYGPEDTELKDLQGLLTELFASIDMVGCLFSQFPFLRYSSI